MRVVLMYAERLFSLAHGYQIFRLNIDTMLLIRDNFCIFIQFYDLSQYFKANYNILTGLGTDTQKNYMFDSDSNTAYFFYVR